MFAARRAVFRPRQLPFAGYRSIAPMRLYSAESASPAAEPATPATPAAPVVAPSTPATAASQEAPASKEPAPTKETPTPSSETPATPSQEATPTSEPTSAATDGARPAHGIPKRKAFVRPAPKPSAKPAAKFVKSASKFVKPAATPAATPAAEKPSSPAPNVPKPAHSSTHGTQHPANYVPETDLPWFEQSRQPKDLIPSKLTSWEDSYHGVAAAPISQAQWKLLSRPLDWKDVEIKPDGVIYLPEIKYRRRLNEAFGPMGWGIVPRGETVVGDSVVTREYALIIGSRFAAQAQGYNTYFGSDQVPGAVEGAKSNALMRCCKDLGIASELWDPHFIRWFRKANMESVWVEHTATKKKRLFWFRKGHVEVEFPYKLSRG